VGAAQPPRRRPGIPTLAILVFGLGACASAAGRDAVDVRWYRYGLELPSGDTRYVDPLDPAVMEGRRYRVETDARGRIVGGDVHRPQQGRRDPLPLRRRRTRCERL
jgi:hypothetical protein